MNNDSRSILKKLLKYISNPSYILNWVLFHFGQVFSDKTFLLLKYHLIFGKKLNLKNPLTFNEKIQWLKLYDRKPEYTQMADKYEVRKYISEKIGKEYLIPLLDIDNNRGGVWNSFSDINFDVFPNQFVLKCTHDSGSVIICRDKNTFDIKKARKKINSCLNKNFYWPGREWVYKNIKPRIIVEKYMVDESDTELKDYKIFCFNGEPKIIQVHFDRFTDHKRNMYSSEWEYIPFTTEYSTNPCIQIKKPQSLNLMLNIARKLSENTIYLRVDLYSIKEKIYFGELTFYHGSGYIMFTPEWDKTLGDWINLPIKKL
jgi:hypothetical protein